MESDIEHPILTFVVKPPLAMQQELTIKLPNSVQLSQFELSMMLAAKMYERGILSAGQAAEVAGISKRTFIELLGKYGVSVFGYSSLEELES